MKIHFTNIFHRFIVVVALLAALVGSAVQVIPVHAANIVVNTNEDSDSGSTNDGKCTLREAIIAANSNFPRGGCIAGNIGADTITFAANYTISLSYIAPAPGSTPQLPVITSSITIAGNGSGNTIIQAAAISEVATWRVFQVDSTMTSTGNLTLDRVTVRNGRCNGLCTLQGDAEPDSGGGIHNNGTLTILNSIISDNAAESGGGIYNNGTLTILNSIISDNPAEFGGGIYNNGTLTILNSIISGNKATNLTAGQGGGIFNAGNTTVTNSTISGNTATAFGGGIQNPGTLDVTNSTISGNSAASSGGGIENGGVLNLTNSTISGNLSFNGSGGGILHGSISLLRVTNSTIAGNTAAFGGGIYMYYGPGYLLNTIVANNSGGNCYGTAITNGGYNLDSATTCGFGFNNGSMSNTNPNLGPLANNGGPTQTMALLPGSPAFERGSQTTPGSGGSSCTETDQRGIARPQGIYCDIGAYENTAVVISGNAGVAGAVLSYADGILKMIVANGSGNYSLAVPAGWSGTVTPSFGMDPFCPGSKTYTNVTANQTSQNYAPTSCPQFDPMTQWTTDYSYNAQQWRTEYHPRLLGDVGGDGDDDIVGFGYDRVLVAFSNGVNGFESMTQWTTDFSYNAQQWRTEYHPRLLGDVNGDGRADIVGFGYDRVLVALSTGANFAPMTQWTTDFSYNAQGWRVQFHPRVLGDVDGDGDDDIIGFGNDRVLVAKSNGVNGFAPMTQWTTDFSYNAQGWRVEFHPRMVGDVNGDGKADVVGFGYDRVLVALSTGSSFAPMTQWTTDFSYNAQGWRVQYHPRVLGDVNGDGMDDIVGFGYDRVLVALSNGSGFASMVQATTDFSYNAQGWRVEYHPRLLGDVNNDGKADIVGFGFDRVLVAKIP